MADDSDQLHDAAMTLDAPFAGKASKPEDDSEVDTVDIPEDLTEVPDTRNATASRGKQVQPQDQGE